MIAGEQLFGGGEAAREDLAQGVEEARFIVAGGVEMGARLEAGCGDGEDALAELEPSLSPGRPGLEAELWYSGPDLRERPQGTVLHHAHTVLHRGQTYKKTPHNGPD